MRTAALLCLLAAEHQQLAGAPPAETVFRWSYMPTYGAFRFVILRPPAGATHWHLRLLAARGGVINSTSGSLPTAAVGETWLVQRLGAGEYTVRFELTGAVGSADQIAVLAQHENTFNRTIRPFEVQRLGLDDLIVPPFTGIYTAGFARNSTRAGAAIRDGDTLGFIQPGPSRSPGSKSYVLGPSGLPKQIMVVPTETPRANCTCCVGFECFKDEQSCNPALCRSECEGLVCRDVCKKPHCPAAVPLLAAPMTFVATTAAAGGELAEHPVVTSGAIPIGSLADAEIKRGGVASVTADFPWRAGPVTGRTNTVYDYDGCVRVTIQLLPTKSPIRSLALRVPLRMSPTEATLMHTVTDQTRIHYAGSIPTGDGEVYNTTNISRYQLPAPFVPYVYAGGAERGVAVFADSDRDCESPCRLRMSFLPNERCG